MLPGLLTILSEIHMHDALENVENFYASKLRIKIAFIELVIPLKKISTKNKLSGFLQQKEVGEEKAGMPVFAFKSIIRSSYSEVHDHIEQN